MNLHLTVLLSLCLIGTVLAQKPADSLSYAQTKASIATLNDTSRVSALYRFVTQAVGKNKFAEASQASDDALQLALQTNDSASLLRAYKAVGWVKHAQGKYAEAIAAYHQALTFSHGTARYSQYNGLGIMYMKMMDYNRAESYFRKVLTAKNPAVNEENLALANVNMGGLADQRHQASQAVMYYQRAIAYYKQLKQWDRYYSAVLNSAISYSDLKQYERAIDLYKACLAYADQLEKQSTVNTFSAHTFRTHAYANLPYPLIGLKKFDEAEQYAKLALQQAEHDAGRTTHLMWIYDALTLLYETKGDYKKALAMHKQWAIYRDSTQMQARNQKITELETQYQTREKEERIKVLDLENTRQDQQIWAGTGSLLMLLLLLGLLGWQYQRIRRSRSQLKRQSEQLSLMMKELHHRVKNNLAIVSSLLKLQSNRLEDEKAVQAVRTGQQRVEAMSLIHQRLYQTDQVTRVNIKEFLTDLAGSLMQAHDYSTDDFDLIIEVEKQDIDVDVAMPLGLIANELITNAFKYAYSFTKRPRLRIGLYTHDGLTLEVEDNGPGLSPDVWQQRNSRSSFGKRLINSLSEQLEGQFDFIQGEGALFRLRIPAERAFN